MGRISFRINLHGKLYDSRARGHMTVFVFVVSLVATLVAIIMPGPLVGVSGVVFVIALPIAAISAAILARRRRVRGFPFWWFNR
jgi:uncharacterized membrane protein YhaH (DUF805 family)